jgi:hypothetical protein
MGATSDAELWPGSKHGWDSALRVTAVTLGCAVVGVFVLPAVFGVTFATSAWAIYGWLVTAVISATIILATLPRLAPGLSRLVLLQTMSAQASSFPTVTPSQTLLLSRLALFTIALLATQAIVRRPIALLLASDRSVSAADAALAAGALSLSLALLVGLYQTGRTIMQTLTLRVIDAAVPTVSSTPSTDTLRAVSAVASPPESANTLTAVAIRYEPTLAAAPTADPTLPRHEAAN